MKKKIKIFSTIASLCLAVALMAFGVYAAKSIGFEAQSTISFTATDIDGSWSLLVAGDTATAKDENSKWNKFTTEQVVVKSEGAKNNNADLDPSNDTSDETTVTAAELVALDAEVTLAGEKNEASVTYTLTFTNAGDSYAAVTVTYSLADAANHPGWSISAKGADSDGFAETVAGTCTTTVEPTGSASITITLSVSGDAGLNLAEDDSVIVGITADAKIGEKPTTPPVDDPENQG